MLIEIIKHDEKELIIKVGHTEESCRNSSPIIMKNELAKNDFYPLLYLNRSKIEESLNRESKNPVISFFYADGNIPVTEL